MKRPSGSTQVGSAVFGLALLLLLSGGQAARAQATRTWVSGVGDDANPCSRTAPCKTFAGAISKTAAGGEISVLDPGGYGTVTITKSITIVGESGGEAGILAASTNGVIVNAGAADKITLRGLVIHGAGTGVDGIRFLAGGALHVEDTLITGFTGDGIEASLAAAGNLSVADTDIRECGGAGIALATSAGQLRATLEHVRVRRTQAGVHIGSATAASLHDCDLSHNGTGILADAATARAFVEGNRITHGTTGVLADAGAVIRLSDTTIFGNGTGLATAGGGTIPTYANNRLTGNGTNGVPGVVIPLK